MPSATVNGADLHYELHGAGAAVLLVHGTGGYVDIWGDVPARLGETNQAVCYDRRGFGSSSGPPATRPRQHAEDAVALLDHLALESAVVVGWSGGGVFALDLAASFPDRVAALVLVEPAAHLLTHMSVATLRMLAQEQFARRIRRDDKAAALAMYRWASSYKTGGNAFDRFPPEWQGGMVAHASTTLSEMDLLTRPYPSKRAIGSISVPTTCVVATLSDPAFPRTTRFAASAIPGARLVTIDDAGHMVPTDRPEALVAAIRDAARPQVVASSA